MKIELLAPAGTPESLNSAINHGANAVYLGLNNFNARGNIENFNEENLRENVKKAHLFGVRVYLTLNTLVFDYEFDEVLNLVKKAIDAKVDAFIVQDIGLVYFLRNKFPEIELHASTQMGIENLEGAKFISDLGFSRVVLARETPLSEIKRIKDNLNVEIEYFVQGALCVSYSGNCYLCSLYANASGNRGKCKQFCRLPIKMQSNKGQKEGYFLSTKDFCMLPKLKELIDSGVTSLKIEGRARRPAYVAGVVKVYRQALDNNFKFNRTSIEILKKLFNRGDYIHGYFDNEKIIYNKTQNHIGVKIGKVVSFKKGKKFNEVLLVSSHCISKGDAIKFFVEQKEVGSISVQDVKKIDSNKFLLTTTAVIPQNAQANLIVDGTLEKDLLSQTRKIKVDAVFDAHIGERAKLTLMADGKEIFVLSQQALEEAKGQPLTKEECLSQISKMGDEFLLSDLQVNLENVFMAKSQLNALRRNAVEKLKEKIIESNENKTVTENDFKIENKKNKTNVNQLNNKKILYFSNLKTLENYINDENYLVLSPKTFIFNEIIAFCKKYQDKIIYLALPIITNETDINIYKKLFSAVDNLGVVANNYYAFSFTSPEKTIVGSEMNVANSYAVQYYLFRGYDKIILSKEDFIFENILKLNANLYIETKMRKTLMHFRHCPFKENMGSNCQDCKFEEGVKYKLGGNWYLIERQKTSFCQFVLKEISPSIIKNNNFGEVIEIKE